MKKHLTIKIYGRVHGVFFRQSASEEARRIGLAGYVDRLANSGIVIEAEGREQDLEIFLRWCYRGSYLARVESVRFEYLFELQNFAGFEIKKSEVRYISRGPYSYHHRFVW